MSKYPKTLNDKAWEKLFEKYRIIDEVEKRGLFEISANQINEFREARLMTKFDYRVNLPALFKENHLAILPITRGSYVIGKFEAYHDFEPDDGDFISVSIPSYIQSIDFEKITSEATAINVAHLTGMLSYFIGEETLVPTINGRMSSEKFEFNVQGSVQDNKHLIVVENSQLEIDGGYEGFDSLTLIEAKNSLSDDFLVRQLYYPFRLWKKKIDKPIRTVFLTYSNGIFNLREYSFNDYRSYNSLKLVKQSNFRLEQEAIQIAEIIDLYKRINPIKEPEDVPFPQADNFARIINICELLHENDTLTREEITNNYAFDIRQTNYYTDACRYLGLVYKERDPVEGIKYFLTKKGKKIFTLNPKQRNLFYVRCILEKKAFHKTFGLYLKGLEIPERKTIVQIMEESRLYNINSLETYNRRASTIISWINWILDLAR